MDEFKIRVVPRPWNKGKLVGQKAPLKLKEIWAIRVRLQVFRRTRELTLFNLGIDSKLRPATCSSYGFVTSLTASGSLHGRSWCNKRLQDPCSSRSRSRRAAL